MSDDKDHYKYRPSLAAVAITITVFTILSFIHTYYLVKRGTRFCIPFLVGAVFEIVGYAARAAGHTNPAATGPYILQYILILLAPIIFAASVYMFLGRIILATGGEARAIIRPAWTTKIFVSGDILCFLIQGVGGGILAGAKTKSALDLGKIIILIGLVLQMIIFGFFMIVGIVFHRRMRSPSVGKIQCPVKWERYMVELYIASILITARNLFRVVEFAMGEDAYLMVKEWPTYIFDALLMAFVCGIACFWHVGQIVPTSTKTSGENSFEMMISDEER